MRKIAFAFVISAAVAMTGAPTLCLAQSQEALASQHTQREQRALGLDGYSRKQRAMREVREMRQGRPAPRRAASKDRPVPVRQDDAQPVKLPVV